MEKAKEFQKNIYFIDYANAFDCVDHNKLENSYHLGYADDTTLMAESKEELKNERLNEGQREGWKRGLKT